MTSDEDDDVRVLNEPADGLGEVIADLPSLRAAITALSRGDGPVAIDAERAHGFRYSQRAYLIQLRRHGSGTMLIDPVALAALTADEPQTSARRIAASTASPSPAEDDPAGSTKSTAQGPTEQGPTEQGTPAQGRNRRSRPARQVAAGPADLSGIADAIDDAEWVIHAATQDLPCLVEIQLVPSRLFDTELAGRLLGYPRVNLGTLIEEQFGVRLLKEHSAADWSTRPLPRDWLNYAALDVELLVELRDALAKQLVEAGKDEWARQEFGWLAARAAWPTEAKPDPWRRTSGIHKVRNRRGLAIVAELWRVRDQIARRIDRAPGRILADTAITELAGLRDASPEFTGTLASFRRRPANRYRTNWTAAVTRALDLPESELPPLHRHSEGPPQQARQWSSKDPAAAARLHAVREALTEKAAELNLPVENLLTPDHLRRLTWRPPADADERAVNDMLGGFGSRPWQREIVVPIITPLLHQEP